MKRRYGGAFVPLPGEPFDHVYIDLSSTLHQVIRRGEGGVWVGWRGEGDG